jgi:DNA repair protein RadC
MQTSFFEEMPTTTKSRRIKVGSPAAQLREVLAPYMDAKKLAEVIAQGESATSDFIQALRSGDTPPEVQAFIHVLAQVLMPNQRLQVRSPKELGAFLMVQMVAYDQEHLVTALLDTKNRVQKIHTVYIGTINSAAIRIAEVFKEAVRCNAASIIVAHNHPSGDSDPSSEDILITRQIIAAGKLLDITCLDHLVIGQGKFVSMRERGLAFTGAS